MNTDSPKIWNSDANAADPNTGWFCGVLVDSVPYHLLGTGTGNASTQVAMDITPTQTIAVHHAGPLNITMIFLSPITVRSSHFTLGEIH